MIEDFFTDEILLKSVTEMLDEGCAPYDFFESEKIVFGRINITESNFRDYTARGEKVKSKLFFPISESIKEGDHVLVRGAEYSVIRVKAPGAGNHHQEIDIIEV